ncbi:dienelactone hydrolase family protein [Pontibacter sp. BT310]|uniref:Dienelactone hydrolase family protein n=1 Tax=Pontibacter populi TaxID=890055 RepID=A0ABS6XE86_9BACT|nr:MULTISPECIES: dienelactone hydrolase family protein [Pontibacter]MBJ6119460.1 dienelactone hydrolase family protein [Pontibacter sp. BT310]MBR0571888.1 dienelactone hydrolase family protein [Microvirga sp. STS03]MBW3366314.1 dienelactone hydrolase family protein [Pontibacter populi]
MANYTFNDTVQINIHQVALTGDLIVPESATGLIVFSHGSGSSRLSERNRFVAEQLQQAGFATLLFDLLTPEEDQDQAKRFDIPLITQRLVDTGYWIQENLLLNELAIGIFGASTGAASALRAAAALGPDVIKAVVSRGGRPDLADEVLPEVKAPTLLIVGGNDEPVIGMNQQAYDRLQCEKSMEIVPGATHLFEEPGTLEKVAQLATDWFKKYL